MRIRYNIPAFILLFVVSACQQTPDTADLVRYMTVQTEFDTGLINSSGSIFNTYSTFTMKLDTMGFVSSYYVNDSIRTEDDIPGFVSPVTEKVKENFEDAGFTFVEADADPAPDFAVNVIILHNFSFSQSINYGGYYPGYGYYGYYNYYYPIVSTYYSNYVTLVLQVVDIVNSQANDGYRVVWSGYIGDLNTTESSTRTSKTIEAVETAFDQSPFISAN